MNRFCVGLLFALLGASAGDAVAAAPRSTSSAAAPAAKPKTTTSRASSTPAHRRPAGTASRATRKPSRSPATPAAKPPVPTPAPELLAEPESAPTPRTDHSPSGASEARVQPTGEQPATSVVKTEAADQDKGVKTYTFGAQEVEGRLRSPQILYFLRRVRAEFDAEPLGHRSFLLELSDTRRHSALW